MRSGSYEDVSGVNEIGCCCPEGKSVSNQSTIRRPPMDFIPITVSHPQVAAEWDYEANAPLRPENVSRGMVKSVHWRASTIAAA